MARHPRTRFFTATGQWVDATTDLERSNTMPPTFASLWSLPSGADSEPASSAPAVRTQTAVVLTLADAIEHVDTASAAAADLRWQLLEELSRLSSCIREATETVSR
jgi:hypothetical protein